MTNKYTQIVFWQNIMSPHQMETLEALSKRIPVTLCVDELISEDQRQHGWELPERRNVQIMQVDPRRVKEVLAEFPVDAYHVFSPRGARIAKVLGPLILKNNLPYALLMERPSGTGLKLLLSHLLYRALARRYRSAERTFAMGAIGQRVYRSLGFANVSPFGYSVQSPVMPRQVAEFGGTYRFICVAALIPRKQHKLIFRALASLHEQNWSLELVGGGVLADRLEYLAHEYGIGSRIEWSGVLSNRETQMRIATADSLILASDDEGWGAVINEAITVGTRAIASDAVGAECLCRLPDAGSVFRSRSLNSLRETLQDHLQRGKVSSYERKSRSTLKQYFDGEALANYFFDRCQGLEVSLPWAHNSN